MGTGGAIYSFLVIDLLYKHSMIIHKLTEYEEIFLFLFSISTAFG